MSLRASAPFRTPRPVTRSTTSADLKLEVAQAGPACASLILTTSKAIRGGEVGITYDATRIVPLLVKPGSDFPRSGEIHINFNPERNCAEQGAGADAGMIVGWLDPLSQALTPPGRHEILRICFDLADGAEPGSCSPIRFTTCLGSSQAPVRNVVTDEEGRSVTLVTQDGEFCRGEDPPFRRGDANGDMSFDISDPIVLLGCLFLGSLCPACSDTGDTNDDGRFDITDAVYLLRWRFLTGDPPPAPFLECGTDPTRDTLSDCVGTDACP